MWCARLGCIGLGVDNETISDIIASTNVHMDPEDPRFGGGPFVL